MEATKRIILYRQLSGALLLAFVFALGCKKPAASIQEQPQLETKKVRVAVVRQLATEETVYATGSLAARERAILSAKVAGRVEAVRTDLGAPIKANDLLVQIEKLDYELRRQQGEAALAQARARLGLSLTGEEDRVEPEKASIVKEARALLGEAGKNRDRILKLRQEGVIPEADVETAEAAFQVAVNRHDESIHEAKNRIATLQLRKAELQLADLQLKDTEIRAPFDGVVEQRQTSPGEFLNTGTPIITVVSIDPIRLRLEVSEKDAPSVRLGQKVHLRVEGSEQSHDGTISRVSPVISADNRMLLAEADVPNRQGLLRPGSFAKADIVVNEKASGLFVPESSVVAFAGMQKVFVVEQGKAVERSVKLGRDQGTLVEVVGKLKAGDIVVVDPGNLRNGQPIEQSSSDS